MKLIEEYLRWAEECRQLALRTSINEHREAIQEICKMWAKMAAERRRFLEEAARKKPDASPQNSK